MDRERRRVEGASYRLRLWLADKIAADLYEKIKQKIAERFSSKIEVKPIGELPKLFNSVVIKTQLRNGDVLLTVRQQPIGEGEVDFRDGSINMPSMKDDGGIKAAQCIITFALSVDEILSSNGHMPGHLIRSRIKDNGDFETSMVVDFEDDQS